MGHLTTITLYNDAMGAFEKDPQKFGVALLNGINIANRNNEETSIPFSNYGNYISIQPSRHADDEIIYFHTGNGVYAIGPYAMRQFNERNIEFYEDLIKRAQSHLDFTKDWFKKKKKELKRGLDTTPINNIG